ncbi:MAG: shikimate dehydrogenase [Bacillota bacterium]
MLDSNEKNPRLGQDICCTTEEVRQSLDVRSCKVSGSTKITGLLGHPVSHSLSPRMQNAAFDHCGFDICYIPFDVHPSELGTAMAAIRALGLLGANITVPHKIRAAEMVDHLSPEAQACNAINTVTNVEGCLTGYNTDVQGILDAINHDAGISLKNKTAIVAGAGGAARAAVHAMVKAGCSKIIVVNRTFSKASDLCRAAKQSMSKLAPEKSAHEEREPIQNVPELIPGNLLELESIVNFFNFDVFINATSLGLVEETNPFPQLMNLRGKPLICDLVYTPKGTPLIQEASSRGFPTVGGRSILVWQGAKSFELWTGHEAPIEHMKRAVSFDPL